MYICCIIEATLILRIISMWLKRGGSNPLNPPLDPALVIDSTVEPAGVNFSNNGAGADLFPTNLGLTENHIPSQPVLQNYPLTSFSGNT